MKIQKHFVLLAGFLVLNACGGETQTENLSDDLIYSKSGLTGRSELSAFFLEDLLLPSASSKKVPQTVPFDF